MYQEAASPTWTRPRSTSATPAGLQAAPPWSDPVQGGRQGRQARSSVTSPPTPARPRTAARPGRTPSRTASRTRTATPITSADVRHTFERQYATFITDGPTYIQQWLADAGADYRKALPDGGSYKGKHLPDTVLDTPDDEDGRLPLQDAHARPAAGPRHGRLLHRLREGGHEGEVRQGPAGDGPVQDRRVQGPASRLVLVKNANWDPKTDSVRHQYVERLQHRVRRQHETTQTKALIADQRRGQERHQLHRRRSTPTCPGRHDDPDVKKRTVKGYQPYVWQLNINMRPASRT